MLTPELIQTLRAVDTPTICNALEIAMGSRVAYYFTLRRSPLPRRSRCRLWWVSPDGCIRRQHRCPSFVDAANDAARAWRNYRHVASIRRLSHRRHAGHGRSARNGFVLGEVNLPCNEGLAAAAS